MKTLYFLMFMDVIWLLAYRHNDEDTVPGNSPFSAASVIIKALKRSGSMDNKYTLTELNAGRD